MPFFACLFGRFCRKTIGSGSVNLMFELLWRPTRQFLTLKPDEHTRFRAYSETIAPQCGGLRLSAYKFPLESFIDFLGPRVCGSCLLRCGRLFLLFIVMWFLRRPTPTQPSRGALIVSFVALALALVTGWLGGELVDRLAVGIDDGVHLNAPSSLSGRPATEQTTRQANLRRAA